jgi:hypothetical protein
MIKEWLTSENKALALTIIAVVGSGSLALIPTSIFIQAVAAGSLGGLIHEIAQSQGKIFFPKKMEDGLYLGSLTGMILGAVSGLMVIQGFLPQSQVCSSEIASDLKECIQFQKQGKQVPNDRLILEIFLAGMALKGIAEAAVGTQVPKQ